LEGDFETGKLLVENYAVKIDETIHKQLLFHKVLIEINSCIIRVSNKKVLALS